jgi:hypothetical protein
MLSLTPFSSQARDGKKRPNAVRDKVRVAENLVTLGDVDNFAVGVIQSFVPVEMRAGWFGFADAKRLAGTEHAESTKERAKFKVGGDLSSSLN